MSTTFPTNPDTYTTKVDGVDTVMAAHINNLQDATTAIEQALLGDIPDGNIQYVKKAATSTDNAIPRFDGTDGKKLQNSGVIINDNGQLSGNGLDGWIYDTDTWTYVSATSFKITGKNVAYRFPNGTKIKLVQTTTKYFYVVATAYSTDTTITITGGSDYNLANENISGQAYSYAAAPQGFPQWFNYTPTWTAGTTNPAIGNGTLVGRYTQIGKTIIGGISLKCGSTTTYGNGHWIFGLPKVSANNGLIYVGNFSILDAGTIFYSGVVKINSGSTTMTNFIRDNNGEGLSSTIPHTWAVNDELIVAFTYETT